jgi:3-deoxy-D-arabino-heptulosonate 7-phosphate (DAHP) synthase
VDIVPELARACVALGAEGIMVEVHPDPQSALSDADQAMALQDATTMIDELAPWIELRARLETQGSAASTPAV